MPRGFYQREVVHPYFTTEAYKHTDQYRKEMEIQEKVEAFFWYRPKTWMKKVCRFVRIKCKSRA